MYRRKKILKGINLTVQPGQVHAVMGPNGSGKSTLAHTLIGYPKYQVKQGTIFFNGTNITELPLDQRARLGLLLSFQHPQEIPGIGVFAFLKEAYRALTGNDSNVSEFQKHVFAMMDILAMDHALLYRKLHDGFSGGEKKRFEMLQMLLFNPNMVIFDEIDSGLDIDALKTVAHAIVYARQKNPAMSVLLITHYQRILNYIEPDTVHVLIDGIIAKSGDKRLLESLERDGYEQFGQQVSGCFV